jgi:hypothetical protein
MTLSEEDRMLATKYEAAGVNGSFFFCGNMSKKTSPWVV